MRRYECAGWRLRYCLDGRWCESALGDFGHLFSILEHEEGETLGERDTIRSIYANWSYICIMGI